MRASRAGPPDGMVRAMERVAEIQARFRRVDRPFAGALSQAVARTPEPIGAAIASAAERHNLDPELIAAVADVESGLQWDAVSPAGALGVMQLMPATAHGLGVRDAGDPAASVEAGARYLRQQLDRFGGDLALALAAYNAGPTAVLRHGGTPPYRETEDFVRKVLRRLRSAQQD